MFIVCVVKIIAMVIVLLSFVKDVWLAYGVSDSFLFLLSFVVADQDAYYIVLGVFLFLLRFWFCVVAEIDQDVVYMHYHLLEYQMHMHTIYEVSTHRRRLSRDISSIVATYPSVMWCRDISRDTEAPRSRMHVCGRHGSQVVICVFDIFNTLLIC